MSSLQPTKPLPALDPETLHKLYLYLKEQQLAERAAKAKSSLSYFLQMGWSVLEPETTLEWNWHIEAICLHVQEALLDWLRHKEDPTYQQRFQNLLVNCPPGSLKSRILVYATAWFWLHCPSWRVICLSCNPRVALRDSLLARKLVESEWYQTTFSPGWGFAEDQNAKSKFENTAGGFRAAMGMDARIVGERADALLVDDPHDPKELMPDQLQTVIENWSVAIWNRVNDLRSSVRIGIMQRVHEEDWSAHVLASGEWEHLCLPMEYDKARARTTAIGWKDPRTKEGEILHPARFTDKVLVAERRRGSFYYAGQFNQAPISVEGGMLKPQWLRFWRETTAPEDMSMRSIACYQGPARTKPTKFDEVVIAVDANFKEGDSSDYAVITVWASHGADRYLLEMRRGQWSFNQLKQEFKAICAAYPMALRKYIEAAANGHALIDDLKRLISGLVPQKPLGSKESRAAFLSAACESGNVYLPDGKPWLGDLLLEFAGFPGKAKHDDIVDSCSWAIIGLAAAGGLAALRGVDADDMARKLRR